MLSPDRQPLPRPPVRFRSYALAFGLIASFLFLSHGILLDLPYYWDELGQFIPAALDIFHAGAWIPVSTSPNVHPPGLMAYLAVVWSAFGYSILATRAAMLLLAAFAALVTFLLAIELSRGSMGTPAFAALALLCLSPLFFAQSMLAQLDMPAMAFSLLALVLFLQDRYRGCAIACAVLVMVKETGVVAPVLFGAWLLMEGRGRRSGARGEGSPVRASKNAAWFLLPFPGLLAWLFALHHATGYWLGNPEFAAYNLTQQLNPVRFLLAFGRRLYYVFLSTGHFIGSIALVWALGRMPLLKNRAWRIAWSFVLVQILTVSALGGAVLERYILPALPVVYIAFAVSLRSLMPRTRRLALAALVLCLIAANFVNPLYPFPYENNLAFVSFVRLEQSAAHQVEQEALVLPGGGLVAAAFPVSDALRNPAFGFVEKPHKVTLMADFSQAEITRLKPVEPDMVVVNPRTWDPLHLLDHPAIRNFLTRWYGYEPEMNADQVAAALSMRVAYRWRRAGLSMSLLERN